MKTQDKNVKAFIGSIKALGKIRVQIGATGKHDGGLTNAELLTIHEFGSPTQNIPARAPVRKAMFHGQLKSVVSPLILNNITDKGVNVKAIAHGIGSVIVADAKRFIEDGLNPGLLEGTLDQKQKAGHSPLPLIATGQLKESITYEVVT